MVIAVEIGLALISLAATFIMTKTSEKRAEDRASRETYIRSLYQAAKDAFGVTREQIDQFLATLDLKMSQLSEATRGSARLSKAMKIYHEYLSKYPELQDRVNNAKNTINRAVNTLATQEERAATKVQSEGAYSSQQILRDIDAASDAVNMAVRPLSTEKGGEGIKEQSKYYSDQPRSTVQIGWLNKAIQERYNK